MIQQHEIQARVEFVRPEARDAATLRLIPDGPSFRFRAGQAIAIDPTQFDTLLPEIREREMVFGHREEPRGFSCASPPTEQDFVEITAKVSQAGSFPPLLSPYLVRNVKPGDRIRFTGPTGTLVIPDEVPQGIAGCLYVADGSGVVPFRSMIRDELDKGSGLRHLLCVQDRTERDILFFEEPRQLERRHPNLLKIARVLSDPSAEWTGLADHMGEFHITGAMERFLTAGECLSMVCGGRSFVDRHAGNPPGSGLGTLGRIGVPPDRIMTEVWS